MVLPIKLVVDLVKVGEVIGFDVGLYSLNLSILYPDDHFVDF